MPNDARIEAMFDAAKRARRRAYAPYSGFAVGAAVLDEAGAIHAGCNVENAAYPAGACAETGAISAMVASGGTRIAAILVLGAGDALCTPCGACRQRIREFADENAAVLIAGPEGLRRSFTLGELLPESFGPDNLDRDRSSASEPGV
ncbi:cytidine deaminase [Hansschlegelia zhihuaiae]|uniref:Cytidine deaminase n=1 Tax=Hansschlegelia zhihuaiae TaxID=405005 RepID=A0A4Q0MJP8_9HYPH|nr:cytidine deaminase [Hansschlegelia zhihuaiae]RXF73800.1 cytidine deaminase [Hansschlegelia zhihuaiae]